MTNAGKRYVTAIKHHILSYNRYIAFRWGRLVQEWSVEAVAQFDRRTASVFPGVENFIASRRLTVGQRTAERTFFPYHTQTAILTRGVSNFSCD
jgi:hypothetical protein